MNPTLAWALALAVGGVALVGKAAAVEAPREGEGKVPELRILRWAPGLPVCRAQRKSPFTAVILNRAETDTTVQVRLSAPEKVRILDGGAERGVPVPGASEAEVTWNLEAVVPGTHTLRLTVNRGGMAVAESSIAILFLPPVEQRRLDSTPAPEPVKPRLLIGAHHCPLWEADKTRMWANVIKHPERTPALGFYAQENPEVSDWETKWALEHGISFFVYCWYRASQGGPVEMRFGSAIHDAFFKSRFRDKMKFTLMWENQSKGSSGVADERDLRENLFPFWLDNYFKHPSYLKVDNRPVLFIYRPEFLVNDLGSVENVVKALDWMRGECKRHGFDGLTILGEYRGLDPKHLGHMKALGLDYTFAYCWHVANSPQPPEAISKQIGYIRTTQELGILPQVVTVSQAWSGWNDEGSIWKIPPDQYEQLLRQAGAFVESLPQDQLSGRMLLLDNWNEWGEGHYLAPYREYGFGYLDAVRRVFAEDSGPHEDLIPEDIGKGPYDTAYQTAVRREVESRRLLSERVTKPGAEEPGLVGWWTFDEPVGHPVARDYSGHRLGGQIAKAVRAPGLEGQALVCDGGSVTVPNHSLLSIRGSLTIECWVKTGQAHQPNNWMVNRVFSGGTATGYRLGIVAGKPCFEIPLTDWSHHLVAKDLLPLDRWVHLAGTFDGKIMHIYVDGKEQGSMERPGDIHANAFDLCLGNFEPGHSAHFAGLLDEVRIYDRVLTLAEVARHATRSKP